MVLICINVYVGYHVYSKALSILAPCSSFGGWDMRRGRKKTSNFSKIIRPTEMERLYACVAVRLVHTRISGLNSLFSLHIYAYSLETHAGKIFPSENIHGHGVMWIRAEYHFYSNRLTTFVMNYLRPERCRRTTKVIFLLWGTLGQPKFGSCFTCGFHRQIDLVFPSCTFREKVLEVDLQKIINQWKKYWKSIWKTRSWYLILKFDTKIHLVKFLVIFSIFTKTHLCLIQSVVQTQFFSSQTKLSCY